MDEETQGRGRLTQRIKVKSVELLGYEMDQTELRLMPYILHLLMNSEAVDTRRVNTEELDILDRWEDAGYITASYPSLQITKAFWLILCEIVYLGYVDLDRKPAEG